MRSGASATTDPFGFAGAGIWLMAMGIVLFVDAADDHTPDQAPAA